MRYITSLLLILLFISCRQKRTDMKTIDYNNLQHQCVKQLTDVIVHDIFAPPVASRIYTYSNLAYYEAVRFSDSSSTSITARLKGFDVMPLPGKSIQYDFHLAALTSFFKTGTALVFSKDSMLNTEKKLLRQFENTLSEDVYQNSIALGNSIATVILKRVAGDNYRQTRGMPKYSVYKEDG